MNEFLSTYKILENIGSGVYSKVYKAQCLKNGKLVAVKIVQPTTQSKNKTSQDFQIHILKQLSHPNIIQMTQHFYDQSSGKRYIILQLMDSNLYSYLKKQQQTGKKAKHFMYQLLKGLSYLHRSGYFHRDIKPQNILLSDQKLKLADFGSSSSKPIFIEINQQNYKQYVSTRWYRAPECILTNGKYNQKMDIWAVGCIFYEILAKFPLFPGQTNIDQLKKMYIILGTPPDSYLNEFINKTHKIFNVKENNKGKGLKYLLPDVSEYCLDLMEKMLNYDPKQRISAQQALNHIYFGGSCLEPLSIKSTISERKKKMVQLEQSLQKRKAIFPRLITSYKTQKPREKLTGSEVIKKKQLYFMSQLNIHQ